MDIFLSFNQTFCGQTIIIKAKRIKHLISLHSLKSRNHLCLCIGKYMTNMQFSADCWRRCVNRKYFLPLLIIVNFMFFPKFFQFFLRFLKIILFIHVDTSCKLTISRHSQMSVSLIARESKLLQACELVDINKTHTHATRMPMTFLNLQNRQKTP